jgi:hypothetical protein
MPKLDNVALNDGLVDATDEGTGTKKFTLCCCTSTPEVNENSMDDGLGD